jgi:hypothetical protein
LQLGFSNPEGGACARGCLLPPLRG